MSAFVHHRFSFSFSLAFAAMLLISCGRPGDRPSPRPDQPPPNGDTPTATPTPTDGLHLSTSIGFDPLNYLLPELTGCANPKGSLQLPTLGETVALDGQLSKWQTLTPLSRSPLALTGRPRDIETLYGGLTQASFWLAVATSMPLNTWIHLELGGIRVVAGVINTAVIQKFRFGPDTVEELVGTQWVPLEADLGATLRSQGLLEVRIARRLVGEAMAWPNWWLRVSSADTTEVQRESSPSLFFLSQVDNDTQPFHLSRCSSWGNLQANFAIQQLVDSLKPEAQYPERLFNLIYAAFDAVSVLTRSSPLEIDQITVVGSHRTIEDFDDQRRTLLDPTALFREFYVDAKWLDIHFVDAAAEQKIFRQAARRFLNLALASQFHGAPAYLREAVATALLDKITKDVLGRAYFLDALPSETMDFLSHSDVSAPISLPGRITSLASSAFPDSQARRTYEDQLISKVNVLGHLLAATFDADALTRAWKSAASRGSTTGEAPEAAFAAELHSSAGLWAGWMESKPYDPPMAPEEMGDPDRDGVPTVLERQLGSDPFVAAASDGSRGAFSRFVYALDNQRSVAANGWLNPDADFGDWLKLLPQRINLSQGQTGRCSPKSDISHSLSLATLDSLLIGAYAGQFLGEDSRSRWEASIDFAHLNRQFLVASDGNSFFYEMSDAADGKIIRRYARAMPQAQSAIEWRFSFRDFGVDLKAAKYEEPGAVRIRLRTAYKAAGQGYCDETEWFSPLIVE